MHQPKETHWLAAIKVLAYIKSCLEKGLVYKKYGHVRISGYLDSGYACESVTEEIESLILDIAPLLKKIW